VSEGVMKVDRKRRRRRWRWEELKSNPKLVEQVIG